MKTVKSLITWRGNLNEGDYRQIREGDITEGWFEPKYKQMMVCTNYGPIALNEGEYEVIEK